MTQIIPVQYSGRHKYGDFMWMILQPEYSKSLFIFNDNEEHHMTCKKGGGNAIMRQFNKYNSSYADYPRSAGIPTGTLKNGGYSKLDIETSNTINSAINEITELIQTHSYDKIFYSSDANNMLGTYLFTVNSEVIKYITNEINKLI